MSKVLIITQSFPPYNTTSSYRPFAWAKYLPESGWTPIIVCQGKEKDYSIDDKLKTMSVYRCDYSLSNIALKSQKLSKEGHRYRAAIFDFLRLLTEYSSLFNPAYQIKKTAEKALSDHPDIQVIVVTARPFLLFDIGAELSKKYKIPWIADYRDDWTTSDLFIGKSAWIQNLFLRKNRGLERKWVSTAAHFTTVSDFYVYKIDQLLKGKVKGSVLENGYFKEEVEKYRGLLSYDKFTITYIGAMYPTQRLNVFFSGVVDLIENNEIEEKEIQVIFLGTPPQRIEEHLIYKESKKLQNIIEIKGRVSKEESIELQAKSDLLFMIPHHGLKGIPSSKIYEYIGLCKKILLCPSDFDVLEKTLTETGLGLIANNKEELKEILKNELRSTNTNDKNIKAIEQYDRRNTTKKLGRLLNSIID